MTSQRPNILWICTDQQRYDTINALGYDHVDTPVVDSLVAEGVAFTRAYCQSPICTPSRASFLTGQYASAVHINGNGLDFFPGHPQLVTKMLADAGYDCGLIGKLHLASAYRRIEPRVDDGYRYWEYSHAPRDLAAELVLREALLDAAAAPDVPHQRQPHDVRRRALRDDLREAHAVIRARSPYADGQEERARLVFIQSRGGDGVDRRDLLAVKAAGAHARRRERGEVERPPDAVRDERVELLSRNLALEHALEPVI